MARTAKQTADWQACGTTAGGFVDHALAEGLARYRDLPWRNIDDAYAVLVSEVMLQQTQVARVEKFWRRFLAAFPTVDALAAASVGDVLALWQGLGYNRRALALKRTADVCSRDFAGKLPQTADELVTLDGIGPATAAGVVAFAYNRPSTYIETNVRTVFLHDLFPDQDKVSDRVMAPYIEDAAATAFERVTPRVWYYALLDYGAYLKSVTVNPSRRSAHYAKQSSFEGSHRQKRSFVVKLVLASPDGVALSEIARELSAFEQARNRPAVSEADVSDLVDELTGEGFFAREGSRVRAR